MRGAYLDQPTMMRATISMAQLLKQYGDIAGIRPFWRDSPRGARTRLAPATEARAETLRRPPRPLHMGDVARVSSMKSFPLRCPRYREPMRLIAFVTDSGSIMRLLGYLGEPTQAQGIAAAVPPAGTRTSIRAKAPKVLI